MSMSLSDHVLLNISTVTGKWFRKFVFNFNLTGVYRYFYSTEDSSVFLMKLYVYQIE